MGLPELCTRPSLILVRNGRQSQLSYTVWFLFFFPFGLHPEGQGYIAQSCLAWHTARIEKKWGPSRSPSQRHFCSHAPLPCSITCCSRSLQGGFPASAQPLFPQGKQQINSDIRRCSADCSFLHWNYSMIFNKRYRGPHEPALLRPQDHFVMLPLPFLPFKGLSAATLNFPVSFWCWIWMCFFFVVVVVLCHRLNYRFEHLIIRNTFFRLFKLTYWQRTLIRTSVNSL